jgi:O-antigen ligase
MHGAHLAPSAPRRSDVVVHAGLALAAILALAATAIDFHPLVVLLVIVAAIVVATWHRTLLAWRTLLGTIVVIVLVIPIKRYELPVHLPLQIEPYRLVVCAVGAALAGSLLIDPRLRLRRTGLDGPLLLLFVAIAASVFTRTGHILDQGLTNDVGRSFMFFASYVVVFYLVTVAVTRRSEVEWLLRLLVGGAAIVGLTAIVESRTGFNVFNHLRPVLPILHFDGPPYVTDRGGARAYASSQHPIAMGAALMMLTPLAAYLARSTGQRRWWLALALLLMGALATKSRTGVVMLVVILVVMCVLQPQARRALPRLLPLLIVVHLAMPGTLGTFRNTLLPHKIVAGETDAQAEFRSNYGVGRIGEWRPALGEWSQTPIFGQGLGTRITDLGPRFNAPILDDQWLGSLLELGVLGVIALLWFFVASIRRLSRLARRDESDDGWLLAALAASLAAYAFGMLTFDAFNFVQVTLIMFLVAGLAVVVMRPRRAETPA